VSLPAARAALLNSVAWASKPWRFEQGGLGRLEIFGSGQTTLENLDVQTVGKTSFCSQTWKNRRATRHRKKVVLWSSWGQ
jgi:hypothetical protein